MNPLLIDRLPYHSPPLPQRWRWARPAAYVALGVVLLLVTLQFQRGTIKALRKAQETQISGEADDVKTHRGAIGRWRSEIRAFWSGENIYLGKLPPGVIDDRPHNGHLSKHPNMLFVVMLLSPFAYMPVALMALSFTLLKVAALIATVLMAIRVVNHNCYRMPDWVALLGVVAGMEFFIADLQHGNTNTLVAFCIVGHLWCYRRCNDFFAGLLLALGICLKLTPALFIFYWIYQREWRVVLFTLIILPLMILSPAMLTGWDRYVESMSTWWNVLIGPSLGGGWYPMHINQSLPAMIGRYFSSGDAGNYLFDPDSSAVPEAWGWITFIDLGPQTAKLIIRAMSAFLLVMTAWAIGIKRLPRDDGRRALQYGSICALMLLLNQRSWDHHATYLIIAHLAVVQAIALANLSERFRRRCLYAWIAIVAGLLLASNDILSALFGEDGADRIAAYGTAFWHFLVLWVLSVVLLVKLRTSKDPFTYPQIEIAAVPQLASRL